MHLRCCISWWWHVYACSYKSHVFRLMILIDLHLILKYSIWTKSKPFIFHFIIIFTYIPRCPFYIELYTSTSSTLSFIYHETFHFRSMPTVKVYFYTEPLFSILWCSDIYIIMLCLCTDYFMDSATLLFVIFWGLWSN